MGKHNHNHAGLAGLLAGALLAAGTVSAQNAPFYVGEHSHAGENPLVFLFMAEELEWQDTSPDGRLAWDVTAWAGRDNGRLMFRSEGSRTRNDNDEIRTELLWWRPVGSWWNLVAGARHDTGRGDGRSYGLIGLQGTAPYRFGVRADLFGGEGGQLGTRVEAEYRVLLTNRLIATPRIEAQAYAKDDDSTGVGSGIAEVEAGIRLRYEFRREFAPYVGVEWAGVLGDTADLARQNGEPVRDTRWVAGLRFWF
jgi:copper resistance protein B